MQRIDPEGRKSLNRAPSNLNTAACSVGNPDGNEISIKCLKYWKFHKFAQEVCPCGAIIFQKCRKFVVSAVPYWTLASIKVKVGCAETVEPIHLPFELSRQAEGSTGSIICARWHQCAPWENTLEPPGESVYWGDVVLCQIILTTCYTPYRPCEARNSKFNSIGTLHRSMGNLACKNERVVCSSAPNVTLTSAWCSPSSEIKLNARA